MDFSETDLEDISDSEEEYKPSDDHDTSSSDEEPNGYTPKTKGKEKDMDLKSNLAADIISSYDSIIKKHTHEINETSTVINVQAHSNHSKTRVYDKSSSCFYCGKNIIKLSSHLLMVHRDETLIKEINNMPKGSNERKLALENLRLKGDFIHNMKVLKKKIWCTPSTKKA